MMENIEQMREKHSQEIKNLQNTCLHKNISDWLPYYWAPGYRGTYDVKVCRDCGKTIETKSIFSNAATTVSSNQSYLI